MLALLITKDNRGSLYLAAALSTVPSLTAVPILSVSLTTHLHGAFTWSSVNTEYSSKFTAVPIPSVSLTTHSHGAFTQT